MSVDYLSALNSKGSGLNITQIVDSLVQAETAPQKDLLQDKIDKRTTAISALATLSSELSNLKTSISGFAGTSKYTATSTSAGNTISVSNTSTRPPIYLRCSGNRSGNITNLRVFRLHITNAGTGHRINLR